MTSTTSIALFALIGVLLAACSSDDAGTEAIRPFTDIAVSDPVIEFDPSGTAATLNVTTDIDAVCAVAYGVDGPAGAIATDQDMGGGAGHSDHHALMTDLQPETEYQYRLQGVAADGALYRSEVFTFTTPAADEPAEIGTNVAKGSTVLDVSSEFSEDFRATNAVDGDLGTDWSTKGDGDEAFITIDLGEAADIAAVAFRTRSMGDGSATTETFTVEVDGESFGPFPAGAAPSETSFVGQVLTYRVESSTGGNTGAVEVEAYTG